MDIRTEILRRFDILADMAYNLSYNKSNILYRISTSLKPSISTYVFSTNIYIICRKLLEYMIYDESLTTLNNIIESEDVDFETTINLIINYFINGEIVKHVAVHNPQYIYDKLNGMLMLAEEKTELFIGNFWNSYNKDEVEFVENELDKFCLNNPLFIYVKFADSYIVKYCTIA